MTEMSHKVLVTGARGFIGAAIVAALGRSGFSAISGLRNSAPPPAVACDLDNAAQVRDVLSGVGLVVHTAYGDVAAMPRQCATLLKAMTGSDANSLVYFSSIAVYGAREGRVVESDEAVGALDAYASGKIACERQVRAWAEDPAHPDRRAIILRPGIVYGQGSRYWIDRLAQRIGAGVWGDFGVAGNGVAALIHIDDLADLVTRATRRLSEDARTALPRVVTLNAVGAETPSWNAYFAALASALGAPALPSLDAATLARRAPLALAAKVWRRVGLPGFEKQALVPAAGELALFARKAHYDTGAARTMLGFSPSVSMRDGLERSLPQAKR
jgi:nucleoside-diphosphate-sugar epimerase